MDPSTCHIHLHSLANWGKGTGVDTWKQGTSCSSHIMDIVCNIIFTSAIEALVLELTTTSPSNRHNTAHPRQCPTPPAIQQAHSIVSTARLHPQDKPTRDSPHENTVTSTSTSAQWLREGKAGKLNCVPRNNLLMLKTHKSGSSTLQNIILRYADKHNLTVVLPKKGHQFTYPELFNPNNAIQVPWHVYNMFTHHARLNLKSILQLMPNDTIYSTILRNPVTQFESLFNYYKLGDFLKVNATKTSKLQSFLETPEIYHQHNPYVHNNYLYDLGFSAEDWMSNDRIPEIINTVNSVFDLVFIAEYFEESLILLRHAMCWDIEDIVYFNVNARNQSTVTQMTPWMEERIKEWNTADYQLYMYFNKTFWEKVADFGIGRMEREKTALRKEVRVYRDMCIDDVIDNGKGVWHLGGVKIQSYKLKESARNNTVCVQMTKPELRFTSELASKLRRRIQKFYLVGSRKIKPRNETKS
ncbi:galactose-3-O-sulfotransferase 2-like [Saccoglossus kowalevskii]